MLLLLLAVSTPSAHASDISAGYFLPGAGEVPEGTQGGVGITTGVIAVCTYGCGGGPYALGTAWAAFGPDNRFAGQIQGFVLGGTTAGEPVERDVLPFLVDASVRYNAVQDGQLDVAPWIGVLSDPLRHVFLGETREVYAVGLAIEYGGERVRLDASTPLLAFPQDVPAHYFEHPQTLLAADIAMSEVGLSLALGKGHTIRFAKETILPVVTWTWQGDHLWVEAGGGVWLLLNEIHLGVGARF